MNHEEAERLKCEIELRMPKIFSILGEAIKESGASGNIEAEIKLSAVSLQFIHQSQDVASKTSLLTSKHPKFSIKIEDQQVLKATGGWVKPCPDPLIAPDGCWT